MEALAEQERARIQQAEQAVARRLADGEAELRRREEQFKQRFAAEEQRLKAVAQTQEDAVMKTKNLAKEDIEGAAAEQAEASVREQRAELARMMADLRARCTSWSASSKAPM